MEKYIFDDVTLYFECGCSYYITMDSHSLDGLSCCNEHEASYQQIENILPLVLVKVVRHKG